MAITVMDPFIQALIKKLGLPKQTFEFNLKVTMDDVVIVEAKYYPEPLELNEERELIYNQTKFELMPIKEDVVEVTTIQDAANGYKAFLSKSYIKMKRILK